jgi:phage protein D
MTTPYFAADFRLYINDALIPAALRASMTGIQHQSGIEGADRVELSLTNEGLRWSDYGLLNLDNKLALHIGYAPEPLQKVFAGEIVSQSASFPSSGLPTLTIAAQDRRHRQQEGEHARSFGINIPTFGTVPLAPDKEIASLVSLEDGLIPTFDVVGMMIAAILAGAEALGSAGDPIELQKLVRKQEGESNYNFLTRLAQENGWEMFIDHTESPDGLRLHFFSSLAGAAQKADVTLTYGKSLIDFSPRISNVGQIASVTAFVWIARIKTRLAITVGWDWEKGLTLSIGIGAAPGAKGPSSVLIEEPVAVASAPRKLIKHLLPKLNKYLTGTGSTIGDPRLQAGKLLRLEKLGSRFSGLYRVTSATHTMDSSGYRTSFDVRKELQFGLTSPAQQRGAPVQAGAAFSGVR